MIDKRKPLISMTVLAVIIAGCLIGAFMVPDGAFRMNLDQTNLPPSGEHLFGTDMMGRDIFDVIWAGGRISLTIGLLATLITTVIALLYGAVSGLASDFVDDGMMRLAEILMSIPQILCVLFLQAIIGQASVLSIAIVIGITGWMAIAKMVRSEVKGMRSAEFVIAARLMGGGFLYILRRHLLPNVMSAVMYMIVTNIGTAIALEATLSFLGLGLPPEIISWGSLMSLSQKAVLTGSWWLLVIPGLFLIATLIAITEIGQWLKDEKKRERLL